MHNYYDVIVIGLGAMGSATLYQLSEQKKLAKFKMLGIDQYQQAHTLGSSHGESRITRVASGEYPHYTVTAKHSNEIWQVLQEKTQGKFGQLYTATGGIIIGSKDVGGIIHGMNDNFFKRTCEAAKKYGIKHRLLSANDLKNKYPQFHISENELAYYENAMGFLRPEACIAAHLALAKMNGATIHFQEKVLSIDMSQNNLSIITNKARYQASQIIISIGAWIHDLLPIAYTQKFNIYRQFLTWFHVEKDAILRFSKENCPVFLHVLPNGSCVYGFPILNSSQTVKIGFDDESMYRFPTSPTTVTREISADEKKYVYRHYIAPYFSGISNHCSKAIVCLYTATNDRKFVIEYLPESNNRIIIASACSGHGFKHAPAIGEALAQNILHGTNDIDIFNLFNE
jgi:sarcosine oxidase